MFNIQPGTGLGFSGSRQIALGLGLDISGVIVVIQTRVRRFTATVTQLFEEDVRNDMFISDLRR